jgi:hypothetical protein
MSLVPDVLPEEPGDAAGRTARGRPGRPPTP